MNDRVLDMGTTADQPRSGYHAMIACDVLLIIGADFPYRQFFPEDTTTVQIDVQGEQLGRRTKVDLGLVGDAKTTLRALLPRLAPHEGRRGSSSSERTSTTQISRRWPRPPGSWG